MVNKYIHHQAEEMLTDMTFKQAIQDMKDRGIFATPVFRITNCQSDIILAIKSRVKLEKLYKLFPENELLKELMSD